MEKELLELIEKTKLNFCCKLFRSVKEREGSLSAMEAFSLEIIGSMDDPTVGKFAKITGISQPNASYKVQSLIKKGYIKKETSECDKRESILHLTDKYYGYSDLYNNDIIQIATDIQKSLSDGELATFKKVITHLSNSIEQKLETFDESRSEQND